MGMNICALRHLRIQSLGKSVREIVKSRVKSCSVGKIVSSRVRSFIADQRGSISILIFSLFLLALITSLVLTDISSAYLAKRSLTQATEAAVQRGSKNLDEEAYYSGKYNLLSALASLQGMGEKDPGIPIDCSKAMTDVANSLSDWADGGPTLTRVNLRSIRIETLDCDGYQLSISTSAVAKLPIIFPFIDVTEVRIGSAIGAIDERKSTNNYYGLEIGN